MIQELTPEHLVLASVLIENRYMRKCLTTIQPDDFIDFKNRKIYEGMLSLNDSVIDINYGTLIDYLNKHKAGVDINYLIELSNALPTAAAIDSYIKQLVESSNIRKIKASAEKILNDKKIDSKEATTYLKEIIDGLNHVDNTETTHMKDGVDSLIDEILDCKGLPNSHKTRYKLLDGKVAMRDGNYIVIAGLPGCGKSALALNIATHFAQQNKKVLYISLEMTAEEMKERLISSLSGVDGKKISRREGLTNDEKVKVAATKKLLYELDIRFYDRGGIQVEHLLNLCVKLKQQKKLDILLIDHVGLMRCKNSQLSKTQQTSFISQTFKQIAMNLKITVITLSQFNRNSIDSNSGKVREPNLTDLKDSNSLGEDANIVLLLYAPKPNEDYDDRFMVLKVAKNRSGEMGKIPMVFHTNKMQYREVDYESMKPLPLNSIGGVFE